MMVPTGAGRAEIVYMARRAGLHTDGGAGGIGAAQRRVEDREAGH